MTKSSSKSATTQQQPTLDQRRQSLIQEYKAQSPAAKCLIGEALTLKPSAPAELFRNAFTGVVCDKKGNPVSFCLYLTTTKVQYLLEKKSLRLDDYEVVPGVYLSHDQDLNAAIKGFVLDEMAMGSASEQQAAVC